MKTYGIQVMSDVGIHMQMVNERCALRSPLTKKCFLRNKKGTVRSFEVTVDGLVVGGFTLRTNSWYLCEVKYIFGDDRDVLDFILAKSREMGVRPVYQVTQSGKEQALKFSLKRSGYTEQSEFDSNGRSVHLWGVSAEVKGTLKSVVDSIQNGDSSSVETDSEDDSAE